MTPNQIFELCSRKIWPLTRHFVRLSKRCKICILNEHCAKIENGICNHCRDFKPSEIQGHQEISPAHKDEFEKKVNSLMNARKYHALLLLSGGKDSAYMVWRLKKDYPNLRLLCVAVNNGFMSPTAIEGANLSAEKAQCDLLWVHSYRDEFKSKLRQAFLDLKGRGSYGIIDHTDGSLIFEIGNRIARRLEVPVIFAGLSWVQIHMISGLKDEFLEDLGKGLEYVFPLAVWRTSETDIRKIVREQGLLPPEGVSPVSSNSQLIMAMAILDVLNNGYSSFEPEFAQLIREGKAKRKDWIYVFELMEFAATRGLLKGELQSNLDKLGLKISDIKKN